METTADTVWRQRLTSIVAYVITVAWAISFVADIALSSYSPPSSMTPLMLIVAGYCFSDGIVSKKTKSEEKDT